MTYHLMTLISVTLCCTFVLRHVAAATTQRPTQTTGDVTTLQEQTADVSTTAEIQSTTTMSNFSATTTDFTNKISEKSNSTQTRCNWSKWEPAPTCMDTKLNLSNIGCHSENVTIVQNRTYSTISQFSKDSVPNCNGQVLRKIPCKICYEGGEWSAWTPCCRNKSCNYEIIGNITRLRQARYRRRSHRCMTTFNIDRSCEFEVKVERCITGRGSGPGPNPGGPGGGGESPSGAVSALTKIIIFTVAGVVMVGLLAFTGRRFVKTIKVPPRAPLRRQCTSTSESNRDSEYSNASFQATNDVIHDVGSDAEIRVLVMNPSLRRIVGGRRMAPPTSNLSIIKEEDDAISTNSQESDDVSSRESSRGSSPNDDVNASTDDCAAMDYMDDVITQIEQDESGDVFDDDVSSLHCGEEHHGFISRFAWNPEDRHPHIRAMKLERLKDVDDFMDAADLPPSTALYEPMTSYDMSSLVTSSSDLSESEDSYSVKDIEFEPEATLYSIGRQYSSLPDVTRMRSCIPDIDDILTDSEFSNDDDVI